jgi:hypothetical protein
MSVAYAGHNHNPKFSETMLKNIYGREMNIQSVDIPAVSMPIAHSLKKIEICGIVLCEKNARFRVALYVPQHK